MFSYINITKLPPLSSRLYTRKKKPKIAYNRKNKKTLTCISFDWFCWLGAAESNLRKLISVLLIPIIRYIYLNIETRTFRSNQETRTKTKNSSRIYENEFGSNHFNHSFESNRNFTKISSDLVQIGEESGSGNSSNTFQAPNLNPWFALRRRSFLFFFLHRDQSWNVFCLPERETYIRLLPFGFGLVR